MLDILAIALLAPATAAALYYFVLTSLRPRRATGGTSLGIAALIPAHNEEAGLAATIASVRAEGCTRVVVVADNCTDGTAEVARRAGAEVLVRADAERRGKGFALAFGLPHALDADAVLVLDADCELAPGSLAALRDALAQAEAAQAAVSSAAGTTPGELVAAVGACLDNAMAAGKARLGMRVPLRGTGMAFRRELLLRLPWQCVGLAEDAEYAAVLAKAGVPVAFAAGAEVRTHAPPTTAALCSQRRRWRAALGRSPRAWLECKPAVLVQLMVAVGVSLMAGGWLALWGLLLIPTTAAVYLHAVRRVGSRPRQLLAVPVVAARLLAVALAGVVRPEAVWQRSQRAVESAP